MGRSLKTVEMWLRESFRDVVVTGPQRSGTTIAAHAIASDLDWQYIDERVIDFDCVALCLHLLREQHGPPLVIQAPCLFYCAELLATYANIVVMDREVDDIEASQRRINWQSEAVERRKYPDRSTRPISLIKYDHWHNVQSKFIKGYEWLYLDYESLAGHPLWVPKCARVNFVAKQWRIDG